ncbi:MAG: Phage DNA polymerase-related protein [Microgenomates group bacterium GW2011_GWA1_48_10]|nr:MAG: Phage DNA polymerase-related protein [Microgenomates group bacterium GW2011_GWA1_48_10]
MTTEEKKKALEKVAQEVREFKGLDIARNATKAVPGEGDPDAKIFFFGEAPGMNEDLQGRPFVGQAGKLLEKILMSELGLTRDQIYITNIVKYRPPENRDPTPAEIEFFRPFLDRQIEIIDPEIVVTLGRYSMYKFLGEGASISRVHGMPRKIAWNGKSILIFPMFHPAAALRQGAVMEQFEEDFKKLRSLIDKKEGIISADGEEIKAEEKKEKEGEQLELI